jgi:hypothetical protein
MVRTLLMASMGRGNKKLILAPLLMTTIMILSGIYPIASAATNQGGSASQCTNTFQRSINSQVAALDSQKAIRLADSSIQLQKISSGLTQTYSSTAYIWNRNIDCSSTLETVNPVFAISKDSGVVSMVAVTENPSMTQVLNLTISASEQTSGPQPLSHTGIQADNTGYQFYGSSTASVAVYQAATSWTVPTGTQPNVSSCVASACFLAEWTGLAFVANATTGLAQDGVREDMQCYVLGCSTSYYGFYEMVPATRTPCPNFPVSPGDSMYASTTNEAINSGGNYLKYDFYLYDYGSSKACTSNNNTFSTNYGYPYYGLFYMEKHALSTLLDFNGTPVTFAGAVTYGGSTYGISTPYGNGWYLKTIMYNGGYTNIYLSTVSTNAFTATWLTSQGT